MAKEKKPIKKQFVKRSNFTEDAVMDINFFKEDIDEMDIQYEESKKLYDEIHELFASTTGGDYVPTRNLRDISELTKSLSATRSLCVDIINKRNSMKKTLVDIVSKRKGNESENDVISETARKIVECVNAQSVADAVRNATVKSDGSKIVKPAVNQMINHTQDESNLLDNAINNALKEGKITMTKNDECIAIADYIVPKFDQETKQIVAVDSRNGQVVEDFPKERLPEGNVINIEDGFVRLKSGESVGFLGDDDFDPDDVED